MTILQGLQKHDNNYSMIEMPFLTETGFDLLSTKIFPIEIGLSVSVIIPAYKSNNVIGFVLTSLKNQTFVRAGGKIEVIIVDDASPIPLFEKIFPFESQFKIKFIRKSKNEGAGRARDEALALAENDLIIFIDSDIVLPKSFISNHVFVHKFLAKESVLVSFRENISLQDKRLNHYESWDNARIDRGDHRTKVVFREDWVTKSSDEKNIGKEFNVLKKSNYFKNFKANKKIELWTLPMMVLTCSASVKKKLINPKMSVSHRLSGWGFNDTCLFASIIAKGTFVIPNLNSGVLHVIERKHTKKNSIKNVEFLKNERVYNNYIKETVL